MGFNPKDPRDRSVSPGSERLRYGWSVSLELWNLRSNVVAWRASLCACSFSGERSQFADCWCFCGVYACASRSWNLWFSIASSKHFDQRLPSDRMARESHEWTSSSATVVVSRIAAGGLLHGRSRHFWEYFIPVADPQWIAFGACLRWRLACRCGKPSRGRSVFAEIAEHLANKTYWKDSCAQEGRPTVFGENHLQRKGWGIHLKSGGKWSLHDRHHSQLAREIEAKRNTTKAGRDLQRSRETGWRHTSDSGGWSTVSQGSRTVSVGRFV